MAPIKPPYPTALVPLLPEFLTRRRAGFTYRMRVIEELGIDAPAFAFVVGGVALQPDEGAHLQDVFNPYSTVFDGWHASAATARGAGLADEVGGRWRATAKGRELARRVRAEADTYLATLEPIPAADIRRLADVLARGLAAVEASDVPKDHIPRIPRFRGDGRIPMVALENAIFGLWQARDDCHMSSWREVGFSGPDFDVLTRVWRKEAATDDELASKLSQQKPADVRAALSRLRADGFVEPARTATTARGASVRQQIEDDTDRRFFAPWPDEVGADVEWIEARLRAINTALLPTS
jgi:helix-turn-helix protein